MTQTIPKEIKVEIVKMQRADISKVTTYELRIIIKESGVPLKYLGFLDGIDNFKRYINEYAAADVLPELIQGGFYHTLTDEWKYPVYEHFAKKQGLEEEFNTLIERGKQP